MRGQYWTENEIEKLTELWITDMRSEEIASVIGRNKNMVIGKANRLGLPSKPKKYPEWSEDKKHRFAEMWVAGFTVREMREEFDISASAVQFWRRRLDLPTRRGDPKGGRWVWREDAA